LGFCQFCIYFVVVGLAEYYTTRALVSGDVIWQ